MTTTRNKAAKYAKKPEYAKIKESLMSQAGGEYARPYDADLVETYMDLWCHQQMLIDDVNTRGVFVTYDNGGGQKGSKRNDSLQDEIKVTTQMLNIRSALGIKDVIPDAGDGDEL